MTNEVPADGVPNDSLNGMRLGPETLEVTSALTRRYALAVNDENPWYLDNAKPGGVIAPPLFGVVPAMLLLRPALPDAGLPLPVDRALHLAHDMRFQSPIRAGDTLLTEGEVTRGEERSAGVILNVDVRTTTQEGEERVRQLFTIFIRDVGARPRERTKPEVSPGTPPVAEASMTVEPDQTYRYGAASFTMGVGPHEDPELARALGYRTMFLHGQCTMAFAAKAVVDTVGGGDPTCLRRLRVRFADVVYPGDVLTTRLWSTASKEPGRFALETTNQEGVTVLADGNAELGMEIA